MDATVGEEGEAHGVTNHNALTDEKLNGYLDQPELLDYSSTIDPSHIVRLIRQLLPDSVTNKGNRFPGTEGEEGRSGGIGSAGKGGDTRTSDIPNGGEKLDSEREHNVFSQSERWKEGIGNGSPEEEIEERSSLKKVKVSEGLQAEGQTREVELGDVYRTGIAEIGGKPECEDGKGGACENERDREYDKLETAVRGKLDGTSTESEGLETQGLDGKDGSETYYSLGKELEEDPREEAGCVLWDLAASQTHADFLVENHVLEVLMASLRAPYTNRIREISLGILGNLACHPGPERAMVQTDGLVQLVVQQLFDDDPPSLIETCRLLSAGLHSDEASAWVTVLDSEDLLGRIMWMAANTMHAQLLEKSTELLLAMVDGRRDSSSPLLPGLLRLGLPDLLTDLMASELASVTEGTSSHGDLVLDIVLQITEALSLSDDCAEQLAADRKLFSLACQVVRLSEREEIGPSAISATVLLANLLAEDISLIHELDHDVVLVGRLISLVPGAGDDPGARNALWSILGRVCQSLVTPSNREDTCGLAGMATVLAESCSLILEDLEEHREEDSEEDEERVKAGHDVSTSASRGLEAKLVTTSNMVLVMEQWVKARGQSNGFTGQLFSAIQGACGQLKKYVTVSRDPNSDSKIKREGTSLLNPDSHKDGTRDGIRA